MADAFRIQMNDPSMKEVPFEDRFGMLVDVEYTNRKNNRLKRLIRKAERNRQILMRSDTKLPQPFASWSNSL